MSKKNKSKSPNTPQRSTAPITNSGTPSNLVNQLVATTNAVAPKLNMPEIQWNEETFLLIQSSLSPEGKSQYSVLINDFCEMGKNLRKLEDDLVEKEETLKLKIIQFENEKSTLEESKIQIQIDQKDLDSKKIVLSVQIKELEIREKNAFDGFVVEQERAISLLREEVIELQKQKNQLQFEARKIRLDQSSQLEEDARVIFLKVEAKEEELRKQEHEITTREDNLKQVQNAIDSQKRRLEIDSRTSKQIEEQIRQEVADEFDRHLKSKDLEIEKLKARLERIYGEFDQVREELGDFQNIRLMLNGASPESLSEERKQLRYQVKTLESKISQLEDVRLNDDYDSILQDRDHLDQELKRILPRMQELEKRKFDYEQSVLEREHWAREKKALLEHKKLMTAHMDDIESRIQGLSDAQQSQSAFPELVKMDGSSFNIPCVTVTVAELSSFADELQDRIACSQPGNPLYFRKQDIQLFLGGLAMSQLHVFQGISGTGKTSLAKAFASAVGGKCTDIAVQAGWRDRDDLLGHFNAFEKRYYEKDCLQALYRAQTEAFKDSVNIILLDEMNLSRPEHYFSEFLSALEMSNLDDRRIGLMESAPLNAPKLLVEGRYIKIPENVWFIGTANHDETTNEFADKTHDRAFVLELPRHEEQFNPRRLKKCTYSFSSLKEAFSKAEKGHAMEVNEILKFVSSSDLTKKLGSDFGLGWGNRFERQARKFLPVVKAAGGDFGLALDHLLSSRMFRQGKVTGRYDTSVETMEEILQALDAFSVGPLAGFDFVKCKAAIYQDLKRHGRGI